MSGVLDPARALTEGWILGAEESNVGPNSVDLRVKQVFEIRGGVMISSEGRRRLPEHREMKPRLLQDPFETLPNEWSGEKNYYILSPGQLYQVEFVESVNLPLGVCALSILRSTMYKSGASGENGLYDSGYSGGTGMTIKVHATSMIESRAPIAQMIFLSSEGKRVYEGFYKDETWRRTV